MDRAALRRGKSVEEIYQKKTPLEHILLRPDTYVGSVEQQQQELWVFDLQAGEMVHRKISYVPALYKVFDEILVNAADNLMRDRSMDLIDVTIDTQQGRISIMNNGKGIPVQLHREHRCYVPELIFGHLLTSDNYDDDEKKVVGGRNGYGAKLANVFSTKFVVETVDRKAKKRYVQVFERNMSVKHEPQIEDYAGAQEFTRVTFFPDLKRFGMRSLDNDITSLMMKRAYDVAGSTDKRCKVVLNGKPIPVTHFQEYVALYLNPRLYTDGTCIHEKCGRWEVAIGITDGSFQQVSFVNSINTVKGGTHVTHVADQLVEAILKVVKSKNKGGIDIKPAMVRNHLWVFVNCLIENPAFDSQTKETLTTKASKFGSSCEISAKTMREVLKSGVVESILDWVKAKQKVDVAKQLRAGNSNATRVFGIPKLEDANHAGTKNSDSCTLILTEGDSAKALAVAGLSVVGRDKYGVFPLKGKVLNVRDANFKQVTGSVEIQNLLKIVGLDINREYDSVHDLRYGSIMLMTDQDHDGSHIKGLLINMVHFWWPSLLKLGFLKEFVTPIVKVWKDGKKDGDRKDEKAFFTLVEFEMWKESMQPNRWRTKYYKGLGTSTAKEAKEYFSSIEQHEIKFRWMGESDNNSIDLAFNKKRADDRKDWINAYDEKDYVDHSKNTLGYSDFVNKELVQFAKYDVSRSIPSMVDGLKTSQRKVLFSCFKKKLKTDIKVAQLVGYISEQSAYHHGEMSLENTIVNLAQTFVGSNNVNLLVPSGQFGTRLQGGKDHAASRYIYTRLSAVTQLIFHPDDNHVLEYLEDDGQRIEPKWYCPVIPMVLVNGADGIGVGWSTSIPNHDPRDIVTTIRKMLRGQPMQDKAPWYRGFNGRIERNDLEPDKFDVYGAIDKKSDTSLEITELPVKHWTQSYKEFLEGAIQQKGDGGSGSLIEDFREYHTESTVHFSLKLSREQMRQADAKCHMKVFKLKSSISISNMVLFDSEQRITKYSTALEIMEAFCVLRRQMYVKRKAYLVGKLRKDKETLSNKARFILMVVEGKLELRRRRKADLLAELRRLGFTPMSELDALVRSSLEESTVSTGGVDNVGDDSSGGDKDTYGYLLGMALWSLTHEKVEELRRQLEIKTVELDVLEATSIEQLWDNDLKAIADALDDLYAQESAEAADAPAAGKRKLGARQPAVKNTPSLGRRVDRVKDPAFDLPLRPCEEMLRVKPIARTSPAPVLRSTPAAVHPLGVVPIIADEEEVVLADLPRGDVRQPVPRNLSNDKAAGVTPMEIQYDDIIFSGPAFRTRLQASSVPGGERLPARPQPPPQLGGGTQSVGGPQLVGGPWPPRLAVGGPRETRVEPPPPLSKLGETFWQLNGGAVPSGHSRPPGAYPQSAERSAFPAPLLAGVPRATFPGSMETQPPNATDRTNPFAGSAGSVRPPVRWDRLGSLLVDLDIDTPRVFSAGTTVVGGIAGPCGPSGPGSLLGSSKGLVDCDAADGGGGVTAGVGCTIRACSASGSGAPPGVGGAPVDCDAGGSGGIAAAATEDPVELIADDSGEDDDCLRSLGSASKRRRQSAVVSDSDSDDYLQALAAANAVVW